ncbi:MAG: cell division protein FtsA [Verrucomicrobiota bacterium]|jgi:cell division protein FtsA
MANLREPLVGLEIGTNKVCALVGEFTDDGTISFIGAGLAQSQGMRKGEIVDYQAVTESVRKALAMAEREANVEIGSVFLGITGGGIQGIPSSGTIAIDNQEGTVTGQDISQAIAQARKIAFPKKHAIIHACKQRFFVDGGAAVAEPLNISGRMLRADVLVIHGLHSRIQNAVRTVRDNRVEVEDIVFNGVASSLAILDTESKRMGALVMDIGAGTTDVVAYVAGGIHYAAVIPVGGDHFKNDLALGLQIPPSTAEQLKKSQGRVDVPGEKIKDEILPLSQESGFFPQTCSKHDLYVIMRARCREIFEIIRDELKERKLLDLIAGGIFITGGVARTAGIFDLAKEVFGKPVELGMPWEFEGNMTITDTPEVSTAAGLVRYGFRRTVDKLGTSRRGPTSFWSGLLPRRDPE